MPNYQKTKKTIINLSLFEFVFYATTACFNPYLVVFLQSKNFTNTAIGTILAINSVVVILAQPFWGFVSDRIQSIRKVFILCICLSSILLLTMPLYQSYIAFLVILAIITFFNSPLAPLTDAWIIQNVKSIRSGSYASIRLWGSLGYAITVYIMGIIVNNLAVHYVFYSHALLATFTIIIITTKSHSEDRAVSTTRAEKSSIKNLLTNNYYIVYLLFAASIMAPHKAAFTYLPNLMSKVGGSNKELGAAMSIMALSEIPIFIIIRRFTNDKRPVTLILISSIFFILKQLLYLFVKTPTHVILLQLLQGPSYALLLNGHVNYIDSLAPDELKSTAQTLGTAIAFGIGGILGSYGGGFIIDRFELSTLYSVGLIVSIAGAGSFLFSVYKNSPDRSQNSTTSV